MCGLLRPYEGQMVFDTLPETLEHVYSDENCKYQPFAKLNGFRRSWREASCFIMTV